MAGTTEELLGKLCELIEGAFSLPLGADRCIVNRDKALGLIDEIKNVMPHEITQARLIVERCNDMTAKAKKEAAAIERQAGERAIMLVNDHKIVQEARNKAADILEEAKTHDRQLRKATNDFVGNTLKKLDEQIGKSHADIQKAYKQFRAASKAAHG